MTSAMVLVEVETAALTNYMFSVCESSHTLSFRAALAIVYMPYNTSPGNMHVLYVLRYTTCLTWAVAVQITFILSR